MSRKHLLPVENEEYLYRLGLTEQDKKVYVGILDSGLTSVGEAQQLTELPLERVLESIRDLVNVGLIKKAQGKMPRYYASLPFFRETMSVEKEALYTLEEILKTLTASKDEITKDKTRISTKEYPAVIKELLDSYYKVLLSPTIKEFEQIKAQVEDKRSDQIDKIQSGSKQTQDETVNLIKPLKAFSDLQSQKYDIKLVDVGNALEQYLTQRKANRLKILKSIHSSLGTNIKQLNELLSNFKSDIENEFDKVKLINTSLDGVVEKVSSSATEAEKFINNITSVRDELQTEVLVVRDKLVRSAEEEITDPKSGETKQRGINAEEVRENFDKLAHILNRVEIDEGHFNENLKEANELNSSAKVKLQELYDNINEQKSKLILNANKVIQQNTSEMTNTFNELSDQDDEGLKELKQHLTTGIDNLTTALSEEGKEISGKINEYQTQLAEKLSKLFQEWQDNIVGFFDRPMVVVEPFLEKWVKKMEVEVDSFAKSSEQLFDKIIDPINTLEEKIYATLIEKIGFVKAVIETRNNDLQTIMDFSRNFDYTKSSDTWVVAGLPSIYAGITDLLMRTRVSVTVVTPRIDLEMVEIAKTMKPRIRITFVADIDPDADARLIKKIQDEGRITLRSYKERDLYACMMDSEEIIFGYEQEDQELIGIRTSTPSMVGLLEDRLNETVIRNSKIITH
jgi:sugar-specific transcriptional regulator TrmB